MSEPLGRGGSGPAGRFRPPAHRGQYRVGVRPELRRRLGEIECPTAIVWGRDDAYLRPGIATELAERIPNAS